MLSGMLKSIESDKVLDCYARWLANYLQIDISLANPLFTERISDLIDYNPILSRKTKEKLYDNSYQKLNTMFDYYETSTDDELNFYIDRIDGKLIYRDVDPKICYKIGITTTQINGHEMTKDLIPEELYEAKRTASNRVFDHGIPVEYIGRGINDQPYVAKMSPVFKNGKVAYLKANVTFDTKEKESTPKPKKKNIIHFQRAGSASVFLCCALAHFMAIRHREVHEIVTVLNDVITK